MLDLAKAVTCRVGGVASDSFEPRGEEEFIRCLDALRTAGRPFRLLGGGSNVLVVAEELHEAVILTRRLRGDRPLARGRRFIGAGENLTHLAHRSARSGLRGLECCAGIPGTVGAAVRINAGGKFGTIGPLVKEIKLLTGDGRVEWQSVDATDFHYRHSRFFGDVILGVVLEFERGDAGAAVERIREVLTHKRGTQPLTHPSAGCIFRNPEGDSAGRLIDVAGCKGTRVGQAMVSPVHANYMVNLGGATGSDFLTLIQEVQERVFLQSGVHLELEVELWR